MNANLDDEFWQYLLGMVYRREIPQLNPQQDVSAWINQSAEAMAAWQQPIHQAIMGGWYSDRVAYAFLAGYQSALRARFKIAPKRGLLAFCVSEKGGARPTAFETIGELDSQTGDVTLSGRKTFVTCAGQAQWLLVAYKAGLQNNGLPLINIGLLPSDGSGVSIESMPDMPFMPEIKRGTLNLQNAEVQKERVLKGDCYLNYAKPFSASEGNYILSSVLAYLLNVSCRYAWPGDQVDELVSLLVATVAIAERDPLANQTLIISNGIRQSLKTLHQNIKPLWQQVEEQEKQRWLRDGGVLFASDKAHQIRIKKARADFQKPL